MRAARSPRSLPKSDLERSATRALWVALRRLADSGWSWAERSGSHAGSGRATHTVSMKCAQRDAGMASAVRSDVG